MAASLIVRVRNGRILLIYIFFKINVNNKSRKSLRLNYLLLMMKMYKGYGEAVVLICQQMKVMKCCNKSFVSG